MDRTSPRNFPLTSLDANDGDSSRAPAIVVFCHLRWNFVYQRPQHLISRLAKTRRVIFVEEPVHDGAEPHLQLREVQPNLLVCEPHTQTTAPGFNDEQAAVVRPLLAEMLVEQGIDDYILWFYSPMALPFAADLNPRAVIYDCMDELSAFANAPPQLLEREAELLRTADAVFTGGPSLYRAKKDRHRRVYCFPSSVDAAHFGQARDAANELPQQAELPRPRLGFFGVIDERFDTHIIEHAAKSRPDWQFVLVGPVVKIDPATLPQLPNLHYFGQRAYENLPKFLAGWNVCLLPFARNEATRFISPTKTLEYMAAERPIVSTPITDVAEPYGNIVYLADTPEEFLQACERALTAAPEERDARVGLMREVLAATSWDATAARMADVCDEMVQLKGGPALGLPASVSGRGGTSSATINRIDGRKANGRPAGARRAAANGKPAASDKSAPVVIIGGGPTGLSAAYHLGSDALLLEAQSTVGGWCRSIERDGFTFDYAGHIMFSNDPYVHEMYEMLLGDNVHWQDREAWIYSKEVYTSYPFQGSLYGLPADVIKECIMGAIESRFGSQGPKAESNGHAAAPAAAPAAKCEGKPLTDCCADGLLESTAKLVRAALGNGPAANGAANGNGNGHAANGNGNGASGAGAKSNGTKSAHGNGSPANGANGNGNGQAANGAKPVGENFEQFIYRVWGAGIAKHFAIPYNRKLWSVPLTDMETSWLGGRVPMPDLGEMIEGALKPSAKPMGPNARFGYPLRGGFQALMDGFLPHVQESLRLNTRVASISPSERIVRLTTGEEIPYDALISTMPLPVLIRAMGDEAPPEVQRAAEGLRNVSVRCVHIGVGREQICDKHWIYYPEETVFHRIFVQGNASPHCNPAGGFGLTCEITYSPTKPLPCEGEALIRRCIDDCIEVGIIRKDDPILTAMECDLPFAYVVYDHARPANVALIRKWLSSQGITLAGRYSEWEYYNSDHAFLAGKKAAEEVQQQRGAALAPPARGATVSQS
ncbi:MAG TPA: FAD-dependent oxidoreductase [Lacipirellulaceae bacterium]|nr:FAD-dependent oxidoreductase [Lacipirellulaceae bacterium]